MVNPLDFIPKLSGFSPMPLGIMAPFMGYQSAALAYNFGLNYEFGKRVIKSMSNEKFNKIANDPILLNELTAAHHDVLLKAFINEVPKVDKIQDLILDKMVELERKKIEMMPKLIAQIPAGFLQGIFDLGNTGETGGTTPPPPGGKGGKSEDFGEEPSPTLSKVKGTLQNFSKLPISTQKQILVHMKEVNRINKLRQNQSRAVRGSLFNSMKRIAIDPWRNLFRKVNGYTNPDPENAMPWLDTDVKATLRDWYKLL